MERSYELQQEYDLDFFLFIFKCRNVTLYLCMADFGTDCVTVFEGDDAEVISYISCS